MELRAPGSGWNFSPFGLGALRLPSDDKVEFGQDAKFRTTDGAFEGLNSSCGFAKVGPGVHNLFFSPRRRRPSFSLSLTLHGPWSFSVSFAVCPRCNHPPRDVNPSLHSDAVAQI